MQLAVYAAGQVHELTGMDVLYDG